MKELVMAVLPCTCLAWGALELIFLAVVMLYLAPRMNRLEAPADYPIEGKRLMHKILATVDWLSSHDDSDTTFESFLSGWFLGTKCSELKRGNLLLFLAWTMYAKEATALCKGERKNVMDMIKVVEGRLGYTLPPGFNERATCIRHTLDRVVPFSHRPLALYATLGLSRAFVRVLLNLAGFRRGVAPCGKFMYWYRRHQRQQLAGPPSSAAASAAGATPGNGDDVVDGSSPGPIVFFHGVGTGLPFYVLAMWKMCRGRTSIIVESPSIMMSLALLRGHRPPSESQLVESVDGIMERHGVKRAAFFGHSFGSISVAWMARRKPHLVSQIVLLDPVCLLLFLPNVARSFLAPDKTGMPLHEKIMLYLVTQEKGISHTLRRHFWWYANILWPEDVKCPIVVGLAGLDRIVPAKPLRRYLLSHNTFATNASAPSGVNMSAVDGLIKCGTNSSSSGTSSRSRSNGRARGSSGGGSSGDNSASGFSLMQGGNRCKVHQCGSGHDHAASHGSAVPRGGPVTSVNKTSKGISGKGRVPSDPAVEVGDSAKGNGESGGGRGSGGDGVAKKVELVYWSDAGHGNVLGDAWALDEFVRVSTRQEEAFSMN